MHLLLVPNLQKKSKRNYGGVTVYSEARKRREINTCKSYCAGILTQWGSPSISDINLQRQHCDAMHLNQKQNRIRNSWTKNQIEAHKKRKEKRIRTCLQLRLQIPVSSSLHLWLFSFVFTLESICSVEAIKTWMDILGTVSRPLHAANLFLSLKYGDDGWTMPDWWDVVAARWWEAEAVTMIKRKTTTSPTTKNNASKSIQSWIMCKR